MPTTVALTHEQIDRLVSLLDAYDEYEDIIDTILGQVPTPPSEQYIDTHKVYMYSDGLFDRPVRSLHDILSLHPEYGRPEWETRLWLIAKDDEGGFVCHGWQEVTKLPMPTGYVICGYYNSVFSVYREQLEDMVEFIDTQRCVD
jgi:hypothetical protein